LAGRFNLEPFRSSGYRRYFASSLIAALGLWVYQPALEWTVLVQTGQSSAVGLVQSVLVVAIAVATLPSGLLTDRLGARRTIMIALAGMGVAIALVALFASSGSLTLEVALVLTFVLGLFDGLWSVPATLLLSHVVEPRLLGAAIGLNFLTGGLGRLIGAPLGGTVLQVAGATQAFVPAAIALALSAAVTAAIPLLVGDEHLDRTPGVRGLTQGAAWLFRHPAARSVTLLGCLSGAAIFAYSALLPSFTRDVLRAESAVLGALAGAGGLGAILAALVMDATGRRVGRGRQIVVMFLGSVLCVGILALTTVLPLAVALVALIVFLSVLFGGTAQLIVQSSPPPRLRAGVMAVYTFAFYVVLPIATAAVGLLADRFGVQAVLIGMAGLGVAGAGLIIARYPRLLAVDVDAHGVVVIPTEARPDDHPPADADAMVSR
jgi:ENTS family enterobactin (siderophore) exporter